MTKKVIALDVGHGIGVFPPSKGVYKGNEGYAEHDFNSKLSIEIEKLLKHNGFEVIMYQKPFSKDVPLTQRTDYYNSKNVDLVYSIHANANGNPDVNGRCVFYWHTSTNGKRLAEIIAKEIRAAGYSTHGNGLHASMRGSWTDLHICRETKAVAVLVENGFMTGDKDFDLIFGSEQVQYIKDMARVHAKSICKYYDKTFKDIGGKSKVAESNEGELTVSQAKKLQEQIDELKTLLSGKLDKPSDTNEPSDWAKEDWERAVYSGYYNSGNPKMYQTREQSAKIVNKQADKIREYITDPLEKRIEQLESEVEILKNEKVALEDMIDKVYNMEIGE